MNSIYRSIDIDLYSPTSYEVIKAQQGDNNSRILEFILYNQGKPYVITDDTLLKFMGHRGDGSYFLKDETDECIQLKENKILVSLTDDILYYSGMIEAKLVMYDNNGNILSTVPFKISCTKSPCDENDLSKGERSKIEDLIFKVEEFSKSATEIIENVDIKLEYMGEYVKQADLSAKRAREYSLEASDHADNAILHALIATDKAKNAENYASMAEEYRNITEEYKNNADGYAEDAKRYYEQSRDISESLSGALKPMGTVTFAELIQLTSVSSGNMYNISDKFETTSTFKEGAGHTYPAGTNVYKTSDGYWDCLAGTMVTSVNGEKGDVTLTADDVGALPKTGGKLTGDVYPIGKSCLIAYPEDGSYIGTTASATGYCKIKLPVSWNNTMISFTVTIFNYTAGTSVEYRISGYNYNGNGGGWHQCTAVCIGKDGAGLSNLPVQFGHDGTNCAIYIGNASTNWSYPQVVVHDILIGYISDASLTYKKGWTISFTTTALSSVSTTISDTYIYKYTHPTTSGNKHIPSGGSTNQILGYGGSSGTAQWVNQYTHPTTAGNKHIPTGGAATQGLFYSSSGTAAWQYPNRLYGSSTSGSYFAYMNNYAFLPANPSVSYSIGNSSYSWRYGYFRTLYEGGEALSSRYQTRKLVYDGCYKSTSSLYLAIPSDFIKCIASTTLSSFSRAKEARVRIIGQSSSSSYLGYTINEEVIVSNFYDCGSIYMNRSTKTVYLKDKSGNNVSTGTLSVYLTETGHDWLNLCITMSSTLVSSYHVHISQVIALH